MTQVTQKGSRAMSKSPLPEEQSAKIVPFVANREQAEAAALARFWDARQQGQPADSADLEPDLLDMVQLLEHYRGVTGSLAPLQPPAAPAASSSWRTAHVAALFVLAAAFLLFTSNTLLSPRSWLLSSAPDPDWIPWISDDWLHGSLATARSVISQKLTGVATMEELSHGA